MIEKVSKILKKTSMMEFILLNLQISSVQTANHNILMPLILLVADTKKGSIKDVFLEIFQNFQNSFMNTL